MHWVLLTVYLNIQTGEIVKYDPPQEVDVKTCLEVHLPELAKDGLVPFHVCKQLDADGNPIPEKKAGITPESPKVPT